MANPQHILLLGMLLAVHGTHQCWAMSKVGAASQPMQQLTQM